MIPRPSVRHFPADSWEVVETPEPLAHPTFPELRGWLVRHRVTDQYALTLPGGGWVRAPHGWAYHTHQMTLAPAWLLSVADTLPCLADMWCDALRIPAARRVLVS